MKTLRLALPFILALTACPAGTPDPVLPPPAATVTSFTVSQTTITTSGEMVTLTWATQDAKRVTLEHVGKGPIAVDAAMTSGSVQVAITANSTFVLTARGDGGTDSAVRSVTFGGTGGGVLFNATPRTLEPGQTTTLIWNVPGASAVTITPAGGMALDLRGQTSAGSVTVTPTTTTRYTLAAGTTTATVDVVVLPAVLSFTASPSPAPGQPVTLSWTTSGATRLTLKRDGTATPLRTETDVAAVASGTYQDTPPNLPSGAVLVYRLEIEEGANRVEATVTVRIGGTLRLLTFNVPGYIRAGFAIPVSWSTSGATSLELQLDDRPVYAAADAAAANAGSTTLPALASGSARVRITLRDGRGGLVTSERTVATVGPPTFNSFTADKMAVVNGGEPVVLSWSVTNARTIRITQTGVGIVHAATGQLDMGSVTVYPNRPSSVFTLTATNGAGDSIPPQVVTVAVSNVAGLTFEALLPVGAVGKVTGHTVMGGAGVWGLPTVEQNKAGEAFIDISATGTSAAYAGPDTSAKLVTLPEAFSTILYGRRVSSSSLSISINGWFAFSGTTITGADNNVPLPSAAFEPLAVAPYWDDLYDIGPSEIFTQLDDVNGQQRLIVQWNEVEHDDYPDSRLTFQAQVFSSGKVVFAYSKLDGVLTIAPSVGITSASEVGAVVAPMAPAVGTTFTFFDQAAALPVSLPIEAVPYVARVAKGTAFVEVEGDGRLAPGLLSITEANPRPGAGITNGEWLEVTNSTAAPLDLNGWTISLGGASEHLITTSVVVPPMGRAILAQAMDLGDPTAGITATYVYPSTLQMNDASGTVSLNLQVPYASLTWDSTSAATAGVSVRADLPPSVGFAVGTLACSSAGTGTYGAQTGTPGATAARCVPYVLSQLPASAFESAVLGTQITAASDDDVYAVSLPTPILYNGANVTNIWVSSNGWITTTSTTDFNRVNRTTPSTANPRGSIAPFWDDLEESAGAGVGMYWLQRDPDMTPGTGDEYTIVSWEHWKTFGSSYNGMDLNFQVKFFANGNIEYHYGTMAPATTVGDQHLGSQSTTWLEDFNGRWALATNINSVTPGIAENTAVRFTFVP